MTPKQRILEYFIITGIVWLFYATLLPIYFYFVFSWTWDDVLTWWITGTPVEFILAYPLGKILQKTAPKISNWINKQ